MKVAIVGGGVAGLAIGWRLVQAGVATGIFEKGISGRAATWAAAGMLAATAETGAGDDPHARLAREARRAWPEFALRLEGVSKVAIDFREDGALMLASDSARARELSDLGETLRTRGENTRWLSRDEARQMEPRLTPEFNGALFLSDDAHVDNRALGPALTEAFQRAGGRLHENCEARALTIEQDRVRAIVTAEGTFEADSVVIAAGAWTNLVGGVAPGMLPQIKPSKGQVTSLAPPDGAALPRHVIWGNEVYLVPRRDSLLIGATVEDAGFDASVSRAARDTLVAGAVRMIPDLAHWRVAESWAGFRPRSADEMPVLGGTQIAGLFVASGQFRNGILFAPIIADIMRDCVMGRAASPFARAFDPGRFLQS